VGHIFLVFYFESISLSANPVYKDEQGSTQGQNRSERLFENSEILKLTILSDFSSLMQDRGNDRSYHKGLLYYLTSDRDTIFRKIKLKTRGNFRRDPANCKYPPIMLKFGKMDAVDSVFANQSKLKLVTQCQLENYVLLEYLAYRINNLLTDQSYRVRLAHITYSDLESKEAYYTHYAFFIENEEELATRIHAELYKPNVVQYFLDREHVISMAMFQYLIGNDDWYVTSRHNVSILKLVKSEDPIAIPFDFDWSELVNANYTKPPGVPKYELKERRIYKGLCLNEADYDIQVSLFNVIKDSIKDLIQSLEALPKNKKQESIKFIERFYKTLNNPSSLSKVFQKEKCIAEPSIQK